MKDKKESNKRVSFAEKFAAKRRAELEGKSSDELLKEIAVQAFINADQNRTLARYLESLQLNVRILVWIVVISIFLSVMGALILSEQFGL